jgi:Protein of unknown function (DUF4239)
MNANVIGIIAFASIFGSSLLGMRLHNIVPNQHLNPETKEVVRLGMGLIATMTALLLGLLVATAKGSYDTQRNDVVLIAGRVAFLDRALTLYGPEASTTRQILRRAVESAIPRMWPDKVSQAERMDPTVPEGKELYSSIESLAPRDDLQRSLKTRALETVIELGKTRMLLAAREEPAVVTPLLVAVITWLGIIFLSFALFAPSNKIIVITMLVVAVSVSSAIFLIMELDRPFDGMIKISSAPMHNLLEHLGH